MKIAIGLISTTFGMLLVVYGMLNNAVYLIVEKVVGKLSSTTGMMPFLESPGIYPTLFILVGVILIVVGCVIYERGIKEK